MPSEHYEDLVSDHESYCLDLSRARITGIFAYSDCSSLGQCLVDTETPFPPLSSSKGHYNLSSYTDNKIAVKTKFPFLQRLFTVFIFKM